MLTIQCPYCAKTGQAHSHALRTASALKCPACHKTAKLSPRKVLAHCLDKEFEAIRKKLKHTRDFSDADVKRVLKHLDVIQQKYIELEKQGETEKESAANPPEMYRKVDPRGIRNPLSLLGNLPRQKILEALKKHNSEQKSAEALQIAEAIENLSLAEFVKAEELEAVRKSILDKAQKLPEGYANALSTALSTTRENAAENARAVQSLLYRAQYGTDTAVMTPEMAVRRDQDQQTQKALRIDDQMRSLQNLFKQYQGQTPAHAGAMKMASILLERALKFFS